MSFPCHSHLLPKDTPKNMASFQNLDLYELLDIGTLKNYMKSPTKLDIFNHILNVGLTNYYYRSDCMFTMFVKLNV